MLQVVAVDVANWVFQALRQPDLVRVHEDPMHRVAIVAFNRVGSTLALYWGLLCRGQRAATLLRRGLIPEPQSQAAVRPARVPGSSAGGWQGHLSSCRTIEPLAAALPARWQQAMDSL